MTETIFPARNVLLIAPKVPKEGSQGWSASAASAQPLDLGWAGGNPERVTEGAAFIEQGELMVQFLSLLQSSFSPALEIQGLLAALALHPWLPSLGTFGARTFLSLGE